MCIKLIEITSSSTSTDLGVAGIIYVGCYESPIPEAIWETAYLTNQQCGQFCLVLNFQYSATRYP